MAGSVNKVILIGNLGADPEIRRTQDGRPIANLRVATSESWRDKTTGERSEKTEWHRVVIFNEGLVQDRRAISEERREGLSRGRRCRPANGRTKTARTAIRPRSCCRASIRRSPCSTAAAAARRWRAAGDGVGDDFGSPGPSAARDGSRPWPAAAASATTWTTRFRSDIANFRSLPPSLRTSASPQTPLTPAKAGVQSADC